MQSVKPQRFTVFGGGGFIGTHLVAHLRARGHDCHVPRRDEVLRLKEPLGRAIYCIGLTADFRSRPFDTVEAHTGLFASLLREARFESMVYVSSARVYQSATAGDETTSFTTNPGDPSQLYDLSKLTAECLCLSLGRTDVKVVRLSNVYGPDFSSENFLTSILRDAVQRGIVRLELHPDSAKDYVAIADVIEMLEQIAISGRHSLYNLASGRNVGNGEIMTRLHELTGCEVEWAPQAPVITFPPLSVNRLREEFAYAPRQLANELPGLVRLFRTQLARNPRQDAAAQLSP